MSNQRVCGVVNRSHPQADTVFRAVLFAVVLAAFGIPLVAQANAPCGFPAERKIILALMNHDAEASTAALASLDERNALIPSRDYYRALGNWLAAYQRDDQDDKRQAIRDMRSAVANLNDHWPRDNRGPGLGIATGHLARVLLEDEQFVRGYKSGMRAVELLERYLESADATDPGYSDAKFLEGIYEVYSADIRNRASWLPRSFRHRGNRIKGLRLIESAIYSDAVFAVEAGRMLLAEVSWRTPEFCRYTDMIDGLGEQLPRNLDIAILRQGLLIKCGMAERALSVNDTYRADQFLPRKQLAMARLRILASLGKVATLSASFDQNLEGHRQIALANAHDVAGNRDQALAIYRQLAESDRADNTLRQVAAVRQRFAFQAPERQLMDQLQPPVFASCNP